MEVEEIRDEVSLAGLGETDRGEEIVDDARLVANCHLAHRSCHNNN